MYKRQRVCRIPVETDLASEFRYRGPIADERVLTIIISQSGETADTLAADVYKRQGHTRWATHGEPNDVNSHPHLSEKGRFAVVHNGIIENYLELKSFLTEKGFSFISQTDTEVIAHLLEYYFEGDVLTCIRKVLNKLSGSYALGVLFNETPDVFYAVRKDSPLVVGLGENENFIASDMPALLKDVYKRQALNNVQCRRKILWYR